MSLRMLDRRQLMARLLHFRQDAEEPVAANWWDPNNESLCIWAAYAPKGADDLADSYVDESGNGNNAGVGVAPTWDAVNGWKFNGTTQYLTTSFVPQNDQSQTVLVQFTNLVGSQGVLFGSDGGAADSYFYSFPSWTVNQVLYGNGSFQLIATGAITSGNSGVAGNQGYRNGVAHGPTLGAWVNPGATIYIGARNLGGAAGYFAQAYIQALALYDCTLTAGQVSSVASAMAAL